MAAKSSRANSKIEDIPTVPVKALVPVNYDGTLFGPDAPDGDQFDCRETDLDQLAAVNAVSVIQVEQASTPEQ